MSSQVQANALTCIEQVMDKLEKTDTLDQVLPMLEKAKVQDPAILMPVVREYSLLSRLLPVGGKFQHPLPEHTASNSSDGLALIHEKHQSGRHLQRRVNFGRFFFVLRSNGASPKIVFKTYIPSQARIFFPTGIYRRMMADKRYGLTVNLLATKVLPILIPVAVSPALKLEQVTL